MKSAIALVTIGLTVLSTAAPSTSKEASNECRPYRDSCDMQLQNCCLGECKAVVNEFWFNGHTTELANFSICTQPNWGNIPIEAYRPFPPSRRDLDSCAPLDSSCDPTENNCCHGNCTLIRDVWMQGDKPHLEMRDAFACTLPQPNINATIMEERSKDQTARHAVKVERDLSETPVEADKPADILPKLNARKSIKHSKDRNRSIEDPPHTPITLIDTNLPHLIHLTKIHNFPFHSSPFCKGVNEACDINMQNCCTGVCVWIRQQTWCRLYG